MSSILEERVSKGAEWLDQERPDWFKKVDTDKLDMDDGRNCIIGQVLEVECWEYSGQVYNKQFGGEVIVKDGPGLGFVTPVRRGYGRSDPEQVKELRDLWAAEVLERMEQAS